MTAQQGPVGEPYRCPDCEGDLVLDPRSWRCADCGYVPSHAAD